MIVKIILTLFLLAICVVLIALLPFFQHLVCSRLEEKNRKKAIEVLEDEYRLAQRKVDMITTPRRYPG
jgi:sensor domain CHASE-containing protein